MMDRRKTTERKLGYRRLMSVVLALVLLCSICCPGGMLDMYASAEGDGETVVTTPSPEVSAEPADNTETPTPEPTETPAAEPSYLEQIAALKAEAQAMSVDDADLQAKCADIYTRLMAVYTAAGSPSAETDPDLYNAVGEVVSILYGLGYDPYAVEDLGRHDGDHDGDQGGYDLSMNNYNPDSAVYWQVMQANTSGEGYQTGTQNRVTSVTLSGLPVKHHGTTSGWSGGTTLSTYYPGLVQGGSSVSKTLTITPAAGYYVTRAIVACCGQKGSDNPYSCETWASENAYEKTFSIAESGSVSTQLPSEAFGHGSNSGTYFILIEVAPIPTPLYVEYDYGEIVALINDTEKSAVFTGNANNWLDVTSGNVYGTGEVQTQDTQFKYAYAEGLDGAEAAAAAAAWKHYANTITHDADIAAANAGYYFIGWKAVYYETVVSEPAEEGSYNNYTYTMSDEYGTLETNYAEGAQVALTTNVKLTAQWAPVELKVEKVVTGLSEGATASTEHTLQAMKGETPVGDGKNLTVSGNNTVTSGVVAAGTTNYVVTPGTYTVVESSSTEAVNIDGSEYRLIGTTAETLVLTAEDIVTAAASHNQQNGNLTYTLTVTNTYSPYPPAIKLVKQWVDTEGQPIDGNNDLLPASVTFTLKDGETSTEAELTKATGWVTYVDTSEFSSALSVDEQPISGFVKQGETVVSTIEGETVTIDGTVYYCNTQYTITNKLSMTDLTISKTVTGNMGDRSQDFTFTVKVNGEEQSFTLKHGEDKTISVPIGAKVEIVESGAENYITKINGTEDADRSITIDSIPAAAQTVAYENNYNILIETGISMDSLPYILLLGLAVAGTVGLLIKRKRDYE